MERPAKQVKLSANDNARNEFSDLFKFGDDYDDDDDDDDDGDDDDKRCVFVENLFG